MKRTINAQILADSISEQGHRITTFLLTYPRFIHAELMTHRMFSRNSASSRAIPFEKMIKMVQEDPFIPIAWQKDHKGMQGSEYFTSDVDIKACRKQWLDARDSAILHSSFMHYDGTTKQLCNRLLEPFMWHTVLVTATEWDNFFELRCPKYWETSLKSEFFRSKEDLLKKYPDRAIEKDEYWYVVNASQAEIHIQALAEAMWDTMNESTPKKLKSGEWHLPFSDKINDGKLAQSISPNKALIYNNLTLEDLRLKVCVSRCARLSYMNFDGEIDYKKDIQLHDRLLADGHASPMEHCARAMSEEEYFTYHKGVIEGELESAMEIGNFFRISEGSKFLEDKRNGWCNNFKGFIPYRYLIKNGNLKNI